VNGLQRGHKVNASPHPGRHKKQHKSEHEPKRNTVSFSCLLVGFYSIDFIMRAMSLKAMSKAPIRRFKFVSSFKSDGFFKLVRLLPSCVSPWEALICADFGVEAADFQRSAKATPAIRSAAATAMSPAFFVMLFSRFFA
jgi:hypothetical protein